MAKKIYGRTASGLPITDELVDGLSAKAEAGYDVEEMLRRRGRKAADGIGGGGGGVRSTRPRAPARLWRDGPAAIVRPPPR